MLKSQFGNVNINNDLINTITKDIPDNYSTLEKCISTYIKICQNFSFSINYFLEEMIQPHAFYDFDINKDMSSLLFNNITCHKFAVLFSTILSKIFNVKTKIVYSDPSRDGGAMTEWKDSTTYGLGHQSVIACLDNMLIWFDPLLSYLGSFSDLYNAKCGTELQGIKCVNRNDDFFQNPINKVYSDCLNGTHIKTHVQFDESYNFSTLQEILTAFNNSIQKCEYSNMDLLSYMLTCKNRFPINLSYQYQITASIFSHLRPDGNAFDIEVSGRTYKATWEYIFTIHDKLNGTYCYFKYDKQTKKLVPISKEDLKNKIELHTYITSDDFKVPGINDSPIDFLTPYFKYLSSDEIYIIKDYIENLTPTCQSSLIDYLKCSNEKQIIDVFNDIFDFFDSPYPCDINSDFAKKCSSKSKCLEKRS